MDVLFEDNRWLFINKPTDISTHGAHPGDLAVVEWLELYRNQKLFVCSRLDKGTSGVLLFAKTKEASAEAQVVHEEEASRKIYHFISGFKKQNSWEVSTPLDGKPCKTTFKYLKACALGHLYSAEITRGRTHQVRRHALESGVAITGDAEYGGQPFSRLCLHASEVFWSPLQKTFKSPMPLSFTASSNNDFFVSFDRRLHFYEGITNAFRCIQRGEIKDFDCSIDFYAGFLSVWCFEPVDAALAIKDLEKYLFDLSDHYGAKGAVVKTIAKNPHEKGLVKNMAFWREKPSSEFEVIELGLKYKVTLTEREHTGIFLDQRDNRARLQKIAAGKRIANLFSYSSSFSVVAAAANCEVVFSVDVAQSAIELGKENFKLNNLTETKKGKFIVEDVRVWLERQVRKQAQPGNSFDIIVCDPPTFGTAQGKKFNVIDEWEKLSNLCKQISNEETTLFMSNNCQSKSKDFFKEKLESVFPTVSSLSSPLDFPQKTDVSSVKLFLARGSSKA